MPAYLDDEFFEEVDAELSSSEGIVCIEFLDGPAGY